MKNILRKALTPLMFGLLVMGCYVPDAKAQQQEQQVVCKERSVLLEALQQKYKEEPIALGVTSNGGLIEVLASRHGTTWTIIVTTPQRMSCIVSSGEAWRQMATPNHDPKVNYNPVNTMRMP